MTRGEKIVAFIEAYCKIPEGAKVGQPIKFQKQFFWMSLPGLVTNHLASIL